jgi:ubiquinone/menaquinone biosynthesis C-methylase UbiE
MTDEAEPRSTPPSGPRPRERATYTYGYSTVVLEVHGRRTAAREAAFFLPSLRPGMRLLDAGCGPGSITAGLAAAVAPGAVVGLDIEPSVLDQARAPATEQGAVNLSFVVGTAGALPFPDGSFDAVFAHTLLEHVRDPAAALRELRRVLRPGGVLGVRDCDWASGVYAPAHADVARAVALYEQIWRYNGGHPDCGRHLRAWLQEAGFAHVRTSASFRWDGSAAESRAFGELLGHRLTLPNFVAPALTNGWAGRPELARISAGCLAWSRRPDAFAAMVMCEAVGRKAE